MNGISRLKFVYFFTSCHVRLCITVYLNLNRVSEAYKIQMRFNDRELIQISLGDAELEGRLNHRRPLSGNFSQKGNIDMTLLFHINIHFMRIDVEVQSPVCLA